MWVGADFGVGSGALTVFRRLAASSVWLVGPATWLRRWWGAVGEGGAVRFRVRVGSEDVCDALVGVGQHIRGGPVVDDAHDCLACGAHEPARSM